jgi:AraC-like DNA-binding protein
VVQPAEQDSRGIVDPAAGLSRFSLDRHAPSEHVARFVGWYWVVSWDLPAGQTYPQHVLPHPVVNLVVEPDDALAVGVQRGQTTKRLAGRGRALGVMFRPGGFSPLAPGAMTRLTDRAAHLVDWLGPAAARWADDVRAAPDQQTMVAAAQRFLAARLPTAPHPCEPATALVEQVVADPTLRRVDALAAHAGVSERTLQRLFAQHVGVSPKWVIRRYRIYEAAEAVAHGQDVVWADLAADLGFADQAHLTREFKQAFGVPPQEYARRQREATT